VIYAFVAIVATEFNGLNYFDIEIFPVYRVTIGGGLYDCRRSGQCKAPD
jgi:hypothetical protein